MGCSNQVGEALERYSRVNTKELNGNGAPEKASGKATPFVKWVGGKRSIISEITSRVPEKFGHYFEPFIGGGALFFELRDHITTATLADANVDLVLTYKVIRDDVERLIMRLRNHAMKHSKEHYYEVRSWHDLTDPIEIAARLIYLNKTCYNGLYRVNNSGEFNVPMGNYTNPGIVQEDNLRACNKALQGVELIVGDFTLISPKEGDFVYFDPPYHPVSATANFVGYGQGGFDEADQERLRNFLVKLHKSGAQVMLSNSNTPFIRKLYSDNFFSVGIVNAPRMVNCKPNKRNSVEEVLITNYGLHETDNGRIPPGENGKQP
jgi:DNA adenine methylase